MLKCRLCGVSCNSTEQYQQHETSSKHKKRVAQQPPVEPNQRQLACDIPNLPNVIICNDENTSEINPCSMNYICEPCNIICTGYVPYQQHIVSKSHLKKTLPRDTVQRDSASSFAVKPDDKHGLEENLTNINAASLSDTFCSLCNISCTGVETFNQHIVGAKHRKKLQALEHSNLNTEDTSTPKTLKQSEHNVLNFSTVNNCKDQSFSNENSSQINPSSSLYFCELCNVLSSGLIPYQQHNASKNHLKKIAARSTVQQNSLSSLTGNLEDRKSNNTEGNIGDINNTFCTLCDVMCTGIETYNQHIEGAKHWKKQKMLQRSNPSTVHQINAAAFTEKPGDKVHNNKEENFSDIDNTLLSNMFCSMCNIPCTGIETYNQHIAGVKHQKKLRILQPSSPSAENVGTSGSLDQHLIEKFEIKILRPNDKIAFDLNES